MRQNNRHKKERNEKILHLYIDDRLTLDEIGKKYGITRERVRQVLGRFPEYKTFRNCRPRINCENKRILSLLNREYGKHERSANKFWNKVNKGADVECWEWIGTINPVTGYGRALNGYLLNCFELTMATGAHRLMWCIWNGKKIPEKKWILHKCDNPSCVNPRHLYLGTPKDNVEDRQERGGWTDYTRKLSDKEVANIRNIFEKEGIPCVDNLASAYNITPSYVYMIGKGLDTRESA